MDRAQFEQEKCYGAAVAIARQLLHRRLITPEECRKLTVILTQKYQMASHSLDLLSKTNEGRNQTCRKLSKS